MKKTVYLSLGSNMANRAANLREAIARIGQLGEVKAVSSVYETEPVEFTAQPWFLNLALELETELMPKQLLAAVLKIEREMGRQRLQPKGPRLIDIDILLFGSAIVNDAKLAIPHPAMPERRFVLEPLAEIAPEKRHPLLKKTIRELLALLPKGAPVVRRVSGTSCKSS